MAVNQTSNQGIPQMSFPFVDDRGLVTQPWFQLLIALWKRTGGGSTGGFVSEIDTGQGLQGGPINGLNPTGVISLADADTLTLLANILPIRAIPSDITLSAFLDAVFGTLQGQLLFRGSADWQTLAPGADGQFLEILSSTPLWTDITQGVELLPLANGDTPGVTLIGDTVGQPIGVPI